MPDAHHAEALSDAWHTLFNGDQERLLPLTADYLYALRPYLPNVIVGELEDVAGHLNKAQILDTARRAKDRLRANAAELELEQKQSAEMRAQVAELYGRVQDLRELVSLWRRRADAADVRVAELESHRPGPAPVATEEMIDAAVAAFCSERDATWTYPAAIKDAVNAALRKGREEGVL